MGVGACVIFLHTKIRMHRTIYFWVVLTDFCSLKFNESIVTMLFPSSDHYGDMRHINSGECTSESLMNKYFRDASRTAIRGIRNHYYVD